MRENKFIRRILVIFPRKNQAKVATSRVIRDGVHGVRELGIRAEANVLP
jgi:hypothetical protein